MDIVRVSTALTRTEKLAVCPLDSVVKMQARVTHASEDELISDHIEAAYDFLSGPDGWLGRCCLLTEEWTAYFPSSPVGPYFEVPMRPLATVTAFESLTAPATYAAVPPATYLAVNGAFTSLNRIQPGVWPYSGLYHPRAYRMTFTAGFGTAADVPSPIKQGIRMLAAYWYRNRESVGQVQQEVVYGLKALCGRYRIGPDHS